jgi:hypothetical protein
MLLARLVGEAPVQLVHVHASVAEAPLSRALAQRCRLVSQRIRRVRLERGECARGRRTPTHAAHRLHRGGFL